MCRVGGAGAGARCGGWCGAGARCRGDGGANWGVLELEHGWGFGVGLVCGQGPVQGAEVTVVCVLGLVCVHVFHISCNPEKCEAAEHPRVSASVSLLQL